MALPSQTTYELTILRESDPATFVARVRPALEKHKNFKDAAAELGVNPRTLRRWAERDDALTRGIPMRESGRPTRDKDSTAGIPR
jgi:hypothetical protein